MARRRHATRPAGIAAAIAASTMVLGGATRDAWADPQASVGLTIGAAAESVVGPAATAAAFHLGGRGSLLLLRNRGADMAIGPYVDVATENFHDVDLGGGAEWLLPVRDDLPVVLSAGAFLRDGEGRAWSPGMEGTVFFGSRSYNFHSWYGLAAGIFAQARWVPAAPETMDLVFGLQIDGELLALPWIFIYEALHE
jgi:hypothetical protein